MKFEFINKKLKVLYQTGVGGYSEAIIKAFFKKMERINAAKNEADLRALKSNHFEKMKGSKGDYSIRLNKQYRLEFELLKGISCKIILIKKISKHYQK